MPLLSCPQTQCAISLLENLVWAASAVIGLTLLHSCACVCAIYQHNCLTQPALGTVREALVSNSLCKGPSSSYTNFMAYPTMCWGSEQLPVAYSLVTCHILSWSLHALCKIASSSVVLVQVGTLRQALHIKAAELSKQAGADIHSRLLYAVAKVCSPSSQSVAHLQDVKLCAQLG